MGAWVFVVGYLFECWVLGRCIDIGGCVWSIGGASGRVRVEGGIGSVWVWLV